MVMRAAASCNMTQANVAYTSDHSKLIPYPAPAAAAVVTVPGPMNAAEITDQNNTLSTPDRNEMILAKGGGLLVIGYWLLVIGYWLLCSEKSRGLATKNPEGFENLSGLYRSPSE
jgi:hypothetical protein